MILVKVGLIGDIHAEDEILASVLDFLSTQPLDAILCTGDIVDGPGDPNRCATLLRGARVICVRGNHDRWLLEGSMRELPEATHPAAVSTELRDYLLSLSPVFAFDTPSGTALLCHGVGTNDMRRLTPDDDGYALQANVELQQLITENWHTYVIGGHTHRSMVRRVDSLTVVNPGTLLRRHQPGFAVADFSAGHVTPYSVDEHGRITQLDHINIPA